MRLLPLSAISMGPSCSFGNSISIGSASVRVSQQDIAERNGIAVTARIIHVDRLFSVRISTNSPLSAIRLFRIGHVTLIQSSGLSTIVFESHGQPGGCAGFFRSRAAVDSPAIPAPIMATSHCILAVAPNGSRPQRSATTGSITATASNH